MNLSRYRKNSATITTQRQTARCAGEEQKKLRGKQGRIEWAMTNTHTGMNVAIVKSVHSFGQLIE